MSATDSGEKRPRRMGVVLAVLAVLGFLGYAGFNVQRARTRTVTTAEVGGVHPVTVSAARTGTLTRRLELTGEVRPWREVNVFAKVPGQVIRQVLVQKGDPVKAGQILALLDERTIAARLQEARSALSAAEAGIEQVSANRDVLEKDRLRFEALFEERAVARRQLDHILAQKQAAEAARRVARAQADQARAVIRQLELTLADHRITAPMDALVTARFFDPGNLSSTERPLLLLADTSRAKIVAFVTEQDLPAIHPGLPAAVRIDAHPGRTFEGVVSLVNPALSPASRSADIEIHIDNPDGLLQTGMYARVTLVMGRVAAVVVDRDAVLRMPGTGSDYLFTVEDDRAVQVNVVAGMRQERFVEILRGVVPGARVVVQGQGALRHGDRVRIGATEAGGQEGRDE